MNYSAIKYADIANGEGVRTSLFVSGCRHKCPFCFNEEAWDFNAGMPFTPKVEDEILKSLEPVYVDGLSLLGGEPFEPENQQGLVAFVKRVKAAFPQKTIWCYTGDLYEDLLDGPKTTAHTAELLSCIDVLVDGPFVNSLKDITLRFRGSSNQRIIDLNETRKQGSVVLWRDDPLYASHELPL